MGMASNVKYQPEKWDEGIYIAMFEYPSKILKQEAPYEMHYPNPAMCAGSDICALVCPLETVRDASMFI